MWKSHYPQNRYTMAPKKELNEFISQEKKRHFYFPPLLCKSGASLRKEKEDKQQTLRAFEAGLSTKDLLNQFTTRKGMQAVLRNVSQRSTEKGSLKAEAGDVSILKMEIEDSSKARARKLFHGVSSALRLHAISVQAIQRRSKHFLQLQG